jgi:mannose-6-phosphate isomerase-like protein (cupin superfamily)
MIEKKSFKTLSDVVTEQYKNQVLEHVNEHCLRMSVMNGAYRWHYHEHTDELFIVLEGALYIEFKNAEPVTILPGEFITIPARTVHKTSCLQRTVNLTFERIADDTIFID